jgi:hypothetical protein
MNDAPNGAPLTPSPLCTLSIPSDDSPALRAGIDLKSRLEKILVLQEDMEAALRGEPKLSELRALLHRADQLDINAEVGCTLPRCCAPPCP